MVWRAQSSGKHLLTLRGSGCRIAQAGDRHTILQSLQNFHQPPPATFTVSPFYLRTAPSACAPPNNLT